MFNEASSRQSGKPQFDPLFLLDDYIPVAVRTWKNGGFDSKIERALKELEDCRACPRNCGVNRLEGHTRTCKTGRHAIVSSAFPHFGEENCLRGWRGSGTIFFGLCNLRCVFCQNWDISQHKSGRELDATGIADLMLRLQDEGCHNINFVTPEHVVPQVVEAIAEAIPRGLNLPIVYNTSAYDSVESLRLMDGLVDIYMPDFKFWNPETSLRLALARDYPQHARTAIEEMHRQVGPLRFDSRGLARRGVLVRHLVMPGQLDEATQIFQWLAHLSRDTYVNIMAQYRPEHKVGRPDRKGETGFPEVNRRPERTELGEAFDAAREAGLWRFDVR